MKIDLVLLTSNENSSYYQFFPLVKDIWAKVLNCKCKLIYIGDKIPDELLKDKDDIILFKPIDGIHTAFIAQNVRLLYPCILEEYENGIMVCDIDSIPLNREYYLNQAEDISNDKFINYSFDPNVFSKKEHNLPYSLATYKIWREIFGINNLDDINNKLIEWNKMNGKYIFDNQYRSKCIGFHFDQQILYKYLEEWRSKNPDRLILFDLSKRKRFGPGMISNPNIWQKIKNGELDDNFFLRPIHKNLKTLHKMRNILLEKYN